MPSLDSRIKTTREKLARLLKQKRDRARRRKPAKLARRRGRPPENISIEKAAELAEKMPLSDVCLRLGVSRSTLYRKGIKRQALIVETSC